MAALRAVCAYLERLFVLLSSFSVVSAGLYIAGGNELTAAASAAGLSVTLSALSGAASEIMAPAIGIFYCLGLSAAISGVSVFEGLAKLFKNTIQFALGGLCTVFCAMLVLQQQLAQSKDGIGARTVRFVLARSVPLVGGALSEAVRTVIGGVGAVLKGGVTLHQAGNMVADLAVLGIGVDAGLDESRAATKAHAALIKQSDVALSLIGCH